MKKKLLLASMILSALLVTGCGSTEKNLSCTQKEASDGVTTTSVMKINFKGNTAKKITLDVNIDYTDDYKSYADTFKETLEKQKTTLEDVGYEVEITSSDNSQKLKATGTDKTLDKSESTGSYSVTKKSLEDSGYACE